MKKTMLICMLMLLCVLLCACEDAKPVETTAAVVTTTAPVETTVPVETTAQIETTAETTATPAVITIPLAAEAPDVEHTVLQAADGKYVGVLFTYPDGSTYQWDCPVASELPIWVTRFYLGYEYLDGHLIEYYVGDGEWLFDRVDVIEKKIKYRHENVEGKQYTFGTLGVEQQNGFISYTENGVNYNRSGYEEGYDYSYFKSNTELPIVQVLPLTAEDTVPETIPYSSVFTVVPTNWTYDASNYRFYELAMPSGGEDECILRIVGLNTLYYSETPMETITQEQALQMFPEDAPLFKSYSLPTTFTSEDLHSTVHFFQYEYYNGDGKPGEHWENDPKATVLDVSSKLVAIVQLDAHYFAKVEIGLAGCDETREIYFTPIGSRLMYF